MSFDCMVKFFEGFSRDANNRRIHRENRYPGDSPELRALRRLREKLGKGATGAHNPLMATPPLAPPGRQKGPDGREIHNAFSERQAAASLATGATKRRRTSSADGESGGEGSWEDLSQSGRRPRLSQRPRRRRRATATTADDAAVCRPRERSEESFDDGHAVRSRRKPISAPPKLATTATTTTTTTTRQSPLPDTAPSSPRSRQLSPADAKSSSGPHEEAAGCTPSRPEDLEPEWLAYFDSRLEQRQRARNGAVVASSGPSHWGRTAAVLNRHPRAQGVFAVVKDISGA
jgi:hypothetical protein